MNPIAQSDPVVLVSTHSKLLELLVPRGGSMIAVVTHEKTSIFIRGDKSDALSSFSL